jgi:CelD/BcsL family acetyltransferase involved in cellulose biosynthesis
VSAEARAASLSLRASEDPVRLAVLRDEWSELLAQAQTPNPFVSWEWLFTWWRHFGHRRPMLVLEARDGTGRLAGLAVLVGGRGPTGHRRWRFLGNGVGGADGLDLLVRADVADAARVALCEDIAARLQGWDALDLEDLPCGSPTVRVLAGMLGAAGARFAVERRFTCPAFAVTGSFSEHLRRVRRRETFSRRKRWLERQPGYAVEVATSPQQAGRAMEDFLRLHHLRWEGQGGSYGIPPGIVEDFHRNLAPLLAARGWLRLYCLKVGGQAIAAVYGLEMGRTFFFYQSGFDPAWGARSPGIVLVGETVKDAYARGLADYDFLRGTEPYKLDWAQDRRDTCAIRARPSGLRAAAIAALEDAWCGARGAARALVPRSVWATLGRARRRLEVSGYGAAFLSPREEGEGARSGGADV